MHRYLTLLLALFALNATARSIEQNEYPGSWVQFHGRGMVQQINKLIASSKNNLEISPEYRVVLTRVFEDHDSVFVAEPENVRFEDDLIIISFTPKGSSYYKLVLNGWVEESGTQIFGMVYHYENMELINGVPLSFIKVTR
jgi:hypothetical protein